MDPDSAPEGSPTIYETDRDSFLVQGWVVTDPEALATVNVPDGETVVEIPRRMLQFFPKTVCHLGLLRRLVVR